MAKQLVFSFGGDEIGLGMQKVDRSKLYGYKESLVLDENDEPCELVTLAGDGRTVVGKGGVAMAYINADGEWCTKAQLTPIDLDGKEMKPVPSSFKEPVVLAETVGVETYLDHDIRSTYLMEESVADEEEGEEAGNAVAALRKRLADGTILSFPFSYRGGLEADAGFLLMGSDGNIFMTIGRAASTSYVGLQESAGMAVTAETADLEMDDMDFGVM